MTQSVTRQQFFNAVAQQGSMETLYEAVTANKGNPVWIEFNSAVNVIPGDALSILTQSTFGWTDDQMAALFIAAQGFADPNGVVFNANNKLTLYNKALRHLGERKLSSLSEGRESRRYLDDEYNDVLLLCLRATNWNFATRAIEIDSASAITPSFGYQSAFQKPADWVKTTWVSTSETFDPPLRNYQDQDGYWLANADTIYVRYVSSTLGNNISAWPTDYAEYVGAALARTIVDRVTQNGEFSDKIEKREREYFKRASANDALDQPPTPWPLGTWTTSRIRRGYIGYYSNSIKNW